MNAIEIAETLINGNRSDARRAIIGAGSREEVALLALDVALAMSDAGFSLAGAVNRVRTCIAQ